MSIDLQVCFVLDYHPPMEKYMGLLKQQIGEIMDDIKNTYPTKTIEIAFVGYGGHLVIPNQKVLSFTKNINMIQNQVNNINVQFYLRSSCRDIQSAYGHVNDERWSAKKRIIFHMGNGPAFGNKYHDENIQDVYPYGHPYLVLEEEVEKFAIKRINLVLLKLENNWNEMISVIKDSYGYYRSDGLYVEDLTKFNNDELFSTVKNTVKTHILRCFV
jgi:hypothetical protein